MKGWLRALEVGRLCKGLIYALYGPLVVVGLRNAQYACQVIAPDDWQLFVVALRSFQIQELGDERSRAETVADGVRIIPISPVSPIGNVPIARVTPLPGGRPNARDLVTVRYIADLQAQLGVFPMLSSGVSQSRHVVGIRIDNV